MTERTTLAESLPKTAVVRVSRASYDPSRFTEVDAGTDEHAAQLDRLKEMVVDGRRDMETVGVTFSPIFNYPSDWTGPSDLEFEPSTGLLIHGSRYDAHRPRLIHHG